MVHFPVRSLGVKKYMENFLAGQRGVVTIPKAHLPKYYANAMAEVRQQE
jgi:hypothetical protein